MQIGVIFPTLEIGTDPSAIRDYAQAVEGLGYQHILLVDHVVGFGGDGIKPGGSYAKDSGAATESLFACSRSGVFSSKQAIMRMALRSHLLAVSAHNSFFSTVTPTSLPGLSLRTVGYAAARRTTRGRSARPAVLLAQLVRSAPRSG